jgi:NADPH-dependent ferric siderophore reductase
MSPLIKTLTDVATSRFFRTAEVGAVTELDASFRRIDLTGPGLRGANWVPGHKIQIRAGDGLTLRTYTPLRWDPEAGTTALIAFRHDAGPGSDLLAELSVGDQIQLFGPRSSTPAIAEPGTALFVGDETSIGLAVNRHDTGQPTTWILEATDPDGYRAVLAGLGIDAQVVASGDGAAALSSAALAALRDAPDARLILTGRAQSIAPLRAAIKAEGLGSRPTVVKAYWDEKRAGLD